jgi:hypothetical protein
MTMDVRFLFEDGKAQIVLMPKNPIDDANLGNMRMIGDASVKYKLGNGKELVIEATAGKVPNAETETERPT